MPALPVRQWVLAVPQRLRYFLARDAALQGVALRLFLGAVEQCLRAHSPGSGRCARIGAIAFIHRFGSALNAHRQSRSASPAQTFRNVQRVRSLCTPRHYFRSLSVNPIPIVVCLQL